MNKRNFVIVGYKAFAAEDIIGFAYVPVHEYLDVEMSSGVHFRIHNLRKHHDSIVAQLLYSNLLEAYTAVVGDLDA